MRGRRKLEHDQNELFMWGVRKIAYYAAAPHLKNFKEKDIYELEIDREIRRERFKNTQPMKVIIDGKEQ